MLARGSTADCREADLTDFAVGGAMKRVLLMGSHLERILDQVRGSGLEVVDEAPDVVLTYGGDGLLLGSEKRWPGVPKLPLRHSRHGKKCQPHEVQEAVKRLLAGDLRVTRHVKVRAEARGRTLVGLNDIIVRNSIPTSSVRYRVWIDDREFASEIVGDGVVVATTFGSTAYYRSITGSIFHVGLGLAFNNSTEPVDHMVLPEDAVIRVRITRGPAIVAADNSPDTVSLEEEDEVIIRKDDQEAVLLSLA